LNGCWIRKVDPTSTFKFDYGCQGKYELGL
jgi:hypothetical protein